MGYRSQVVIALNKDQYEQDLLLHEAFPSLLREKPVYTCEDYVIWDWASLKWYEGYPDVKEVDAYFNHLCELETETPLHGFIRVGEDLDDVEILGDPFHFNIDIVREITY